MLEKTRPINIVITHGLPDDNPGGSAIALGMIHSLKRKYSNARISLISYYAVKKELPKIHRYLKKEYPDIELLPSPIQSRIESYNGKLPFSRYIRGIHWILGILKSTMLLFLPSAWLKSDTFMRLRQADIVLSRGTQIFYDKPRYPFRNFISLYWILFPILLSVKFRKKYIIYAHSFGPMYKSSSLWLMKQVLQRIDLILAREEISSDFLKSLGISPQKIRIVPDAAFGMDPPSEKSVRSFVTQMRLPFRKYLVVTVREWNDAGDTDSFLSKMACFLDSVLEKNKIEKCAIVVHVRRGPSKSEDDTNISKKLYNYIKNKGRVVLINKELSPAELIKLYSGAMVMIGTRLHSVLMALIGGTPSLAISYSGPKTYGIMRMLDLQNFVIKMDNFDEKRAIELVQRLVDYKSEWRKLIHKKVLHVHNQALQTPELLFVTRNHKL